VSLLADNAVGAVAALFLLMGVGALLAPGLVLRQFGVKALTKAGRNEVRAVYGGFGVAAGLILLYADMTPAVREGVLLAVIAALLGMAAGRAFSFVTDRAVGLAPALYFIVEIAAAALLALAAGGV